MSGAQLNIRVHKTSVIIILLVSNFCTNNLVVESNQRFVLPIVTIYLFDT